MPLDLEFVRARFPGLASPWAFMDNAGGSHVLANVGDRVRDFLLTTPVQHGASYEPSREAAARVAATTARIAAMIGAARPEEVVVGGSTTFLLQQLARAMASSLRPGDEIVVTDVDHESNIGPWRALESRGVVIREWQVDPQSLELDLAALDRLLGPRTRLVCVTHCSNVLGTVMPVPEIARRAHAVGAELCIDGVALAPHRNVDVQVLGCDWYVYSFYKTFGPHQAVLWGRYQRLLELDSLNHFFIGRDRVPYKLQPGNVNYELAWGCAGIPDYLAELTAHHGADAFELIAAHEEALTARLLDWLTARNDVRVIGRRSADRQHRVATVSFVVEGRRSEDIVASVDRARVGIRHGDFYARRLVEHLGLADRGGVVRVSMVHYNTQAEVDRLIAALDQALRG
ncbi:MAG: aminotransferase class V-fold PLP-dependent enzyme [Geminicoccaceae bacterium]